MSNESGLARVDARPVSRGVVPSSIEELWRFAQAAAKSGLFGAQSAEQAFIVLQTGMELGLLPTQALRGIYVVSGKPVLSADLCVALIVNSSLCEYWRTVESTPDVCTIETKRRGAPAPATKTWTAADAKRADLSGKGTWRSYPAQMLRHRCAADLARETYPDVLMGLYVPAEFDDTRDMRREEPAEEPAEEPKSNEPPQLIHARNMLLEHRADLSHERAANIFLDAEADGLSVDYLADVHAVAMGILHGSAAALTRAVESERAKRAYPAVTRDTAGHVRVTGPATWHANDTAPSAAVVTEPPALAAFKTAIEANDLTPSDVVAAWRQRATALKAEGTLDAARADAVRVVAILLGKGEGEAAEWLKAALAPAPKDDGPGKGKRPGPRAVTAAEAQGTGEHAAGTASSTVAEQRSAWFAYLTRPEVTHSSHVANGVAKHEAAYPALGDELTRMAIARMVSLSANESLPLGEMQALNAIKTARNALAKKHKATADAMPKQLRATG